MMPVIIDMADTCNPEGAQCLIIGGTPAIVSAICGICRMVILGILQQLRGPEDK